MSFPDFLEVMHRHSQVEHIPEEILAAFQGHDPKRTGSISARELRHILLHWGERLSHKEGVCTCVCVCVCVCVLGLKTDEG